MPSDAPEGLRVGLRPVASSVPMTFSGLAIASLLVSGVQLGWFGVVPDTATIGLLIIASAVPLQFLAAAWGFATRSTQAATASAVLGGTWLATALTFLAHPGISATPRPLGVLVLVAAAILFGAAATDLVAGSLLPAAVIALAGARFALTGVSALAAGHTWGNVSGVAGIVVSGVAIAAVTALHLASVRGRGEGRYGAVADEPGVRPTL